ncbi:glycosyltransferase [Vibrio breoganii]
MKKIILVNSLDSGGAERVVSILSHNIYDDVLICTLYNDKFYQLSDKTTHINLSNISGNEVWTKRFLNILKSILELKKVIKEEHVQVVQSHMYLSNYINIITKLLGSKHKAQIVNCDSVSSKFGSKVSDRINKILIVSLYRFADIVISKSIAMQIDLKKYVSKGNFKVINNPINLDFVLEKSNLTPTWSRESVSFSKVIGCVSRFHHQKRQADLIKSLANLDLDTGVVFMGQGECLEQCKLLVEELGLEKRVVFLGNVQNPFSILKQCDLFVLTSEAEGLPNVLIESLAVGIPIVSSDCLSGPREILYPSSDQTKILKFDECFEVGEYGVLYPVGNVEELSKAISYYFDGNIFLPEPLEKRAQDFSVDKICKMYSEILQND